MELGASQSPGMNLAPQGLNVDLGAPQGLKDRPVPGSLDAQEWPWLGDALRGVVDLENVADRRFGPCGILPTGRVGAGAAAQSACHRDSEYQPPSARAA